MNLWCKVGVSEIHGVGIIALKYIPMGTVLTSAPEKYQSIETLEYNTDSFCKNQIEYLSSIHCFDPRDRIVKIPETGFNLYWLQSFVNHSSKPNAVMCYINSTYSDIINIVDIKPGEEITINFTKAYPAFYTKDKKWAKK